MGEEICAWIVLKPNTTLSYEELKSFSQGNIAHFKIPKYIKIVDNFIINASGKILKYKMSEIAKKELNL